MLIKVGGSKPPHPLARPQKMMPMDAKPARHPYFRSLWALCRRACLVALLGPTFAIGLAGETPTAEVHDDFDVVIAGGSTAAFAAALAAADSGARTALIEPTDWVGGQLTSSGVPAVDEAWHSITSKDPAAKPYSVSAVARTPAAVIAQLRARE